MLMQILGQPDEHYDDGERNLAKLDPAWAKAALFFRTGRHYGHSDIRARSLNRISEAIEVFKVRFEKGDTLSLLQAVACCAEENLPLPSWLALAYGEALRSFLQPGKIASLDEVFSSSSLPTDTPAKAAKARQDWALGGEIWLKVWKAIKADKSLTSLDAALSVVLADRKFGVQKTKARTLVAMIDKNQTEHLKKSKSISRFLEIRRKQMTSK